MFTITKQFAFDASHQLLHLPEEHKCHRLHGHTYVVIFKLRAEALDEKGFVQDYNDLTYVKQWIDTHLDHRHLNDVLPCYPTAELIAHYLFETFRHEYPKLYSVTVKETPNTEATYEELSGQ